MLALIFFLPSIRAYVLFIPRAVYFGPLLVLVALALLKMWRTPRLAISPILVLYVTLVAFFCIWLMVSSFWTISSSQYQIDLVLLGTILVLVVSCAVLLDNQSIEIFFRLVCLIGAIVGLAVIGEFLILGSFNAGGTHLYDVYLTIAHLLGLAATGASIRYLASEKNSWGWGVIAGILFLELALSLARGALLSTLLIFLVFSVGILVYQLWRNPGFGNWASGITKFGTTFLLGLGTITMALQVERTRSRLLRMFSGTELEEGGRGSIWREALGNIQDSPWLGFGLSSSGPLSMGMESDYPHNLFLQVWLDGGLLALVLLTIILAVPILSVARVIMKPDFDREPLLFPLVGMYCFLFLEYSKSGNFYTGRGIFLFGLCMIMLAGNCSLERRLK